VPLHRPFYSGYRQGLINKPYFGRGQGMISDTAKPTLVEEFALNCSISGISSLF
jgi:hypothetical protein